MTFTFSWSGSRVPKEVKLPNGIIESVSYMRDGICTFLSGRSATYERKGDNEAEFTMIEDMSQAYIAVLDYRARKA